MKRAGIVVMAMMLVALTTTAQAREPGWYLGVGAGLPESDDTSEPDASTGIKLSGGYDFSGPLSAELTYIDFGKFSGSYTSSRSKAYSFSMLASAPVSSSVSLFGKLSVLSWESSNSGLFAGFGSSMNGTSGAWGVGLQYMATRNFGFRFEYEFFNDVAAAGIAMPSLSVVGHF